MSETFLTREQTYAKEVFERIEPFIEKDRATQKKYGSLAHKLPVLIRTAGLAQSLAFVKARNKEEGAPQRQLLRDLESVLRKTSVLASEQTLVECSRLAGFDEYMRLTESALEALLWFKRFAQSELKVEPGDEAEEDRDATG
jgi:CRISPR-associated protein Cmr5